jgi:hypothetical protein
MGARMLQHAELVMSAFHAAERGTEPSSATASLRNGDRPGPCRIAAGDGAIERASGVTKAISCH